MAHTTTTIDFAELFAFCDLHASRWPLWRGREPFGFLSDLTYPRHFDRAGFPIPGELRGDEMAMPFLIWAERMSADPDLKIVARDEFQDGSWLSTVWLGHDHQWVTGPPLIFETMYFSGNVETMNLQPISDRETTYHPTLEFPDPCGEQDEMTTQCRYSTEEEALATHHEIARRIRKRWEV